jgi:lysophosphatidate acyltransferase
VFGLPLQAMCSVYCTLAICIGLGMIEVIPPRTTALAKKELMYAGPFGLAAWLGGMIFVDRLNRDKAHEVLENAAKVMIERDVSL